MIANTTKLNTPGAKLANLAGVHALTDVTGFGLLGHLLELCRGAKLAAEVSMAQVPLLCRASEALAEQGFVTGASGRNWACYGQDVVLDGVNDVKKNAVDRPSDQRGLPGCLLADAVRCGPVDLPRRGLRARGRDRTPGQRASPKCAWWAEAAESTPTQRRFRRACPIIAPRRERRGSRPPRQ